MLQVWSVYPTFCIRRDDEAIGRTPNPLAAAIQDVGIDHCRFYVAIAQQLLHRFGFEARKAESRWRLRKIEGQWWGVGYRNGGRVQGGAREGQTKSPTPEDARLAHRDETGGWSYIEMVTVGLKVGPWSVSVLPRS